jgi:hypothetical protein
VTCKCTDRYGFAKRLYATEAEALKHIRQDDIALYRCPEGKGWHLTKTASTGRDLLPPESDIENPIEVFEAYMREYDEPSSSPPKSVQPETKQKHIDKRRRLSRAYLSMVGDMRR